jgi:hypothetical protein
LFVERLQPLSESQAGLDCCLILSCFLSKGYKMAGNVQFIQYFRKYRINPDNTITYYGPIRGVFAVSVDTETGNIQVGHSLQNKNDFYDRNRGVQIAMGRRDTRRPHRLEDDKFGMHEMDYDEIYDEDGNLIIDGEVPSSAFFTSKGSPPTGGYSIPWAMREFYENIIIPRIYRILNPREKKPVTADVRSSFNDRETDLIEIASEKKPQTATTTSGRRYEF